MTSARSRGGLRAGASSRGGHSPISIRAFSMRITVSSFSSGGAPAAGTGAAGSFTGSGGFFLSSSSFFLFSRCFSSFFRNSSRSLKRSFFLRSSPDRRSGLLGSGAPRRSTPVRRSMPERRSKAGRFLYFSHSLSKSASVQPSVRTFPSSSTSRPWKP